MLPPDGDESGGDSSPDVAPGDGEGIGDEELPDEWRDARQSEAAAEATRLKAFTTAVVAEMMKRIEGIVENADKLEKAGGV
jgi:hypothetical protein